MRGIKYKRRDIVIGYSRIDGQPDCPSIGGFEDAATFCSGIEDLGMRGSDYKDRNHSAVRPLVRPEDASSGISAQNQTQQGYPRCVLREPAGPVSYHCHPSFPG